MSAIISNCGLYRYRLGRSFSKPGIRFAYFGVNPSTADADLDDQTVMKWRGFTDRNCGAGFVVGNVFAYRATNVKELAGVEDPVGPLNASHLTDIMTYADILVPCWGDRAKVPKDLRRQFDIMTARLFCTGKPVMAFGSTKGGDPKHPLMLAYDTELVAWKR
ncbi:DUF1643 domain-containing protein [Paraburkholderia domus]|uniref:DUF1643 domain-containing protein n=1 Tax=Paraburkholderia domus TaxID=2793075 RepID=UPI0019130A31|nr:DUF1643 domain-containing protein [Paraburkholderia domus]MBK5058688.1 DUF1643 domain-containing protein [Burkholderia sp. R-70199]CAE6877147.1 hypothetical protein R70199_02246 [Paraburkholderia domus]